MTPRDRDSQRRKRKRKDEMSGDEPTNPDPSATDHVEKHAKRDTSAGEGCIASQVETIAEPTPVESNDEGNQSCDDQVSTLKQMSPEVDQQSPTELGNDHSRKSPHHSPSVGEESDQRGWREKYEALMKETIELHDTYVEQIEHVQEMLKDSEQREKRLVGGKTADERLGFRRDFGHLIYPREVNREYRSIYTKVMKLCAALSNRVTPSTTERLSQDPEFWVIASLGKEPWVQKLLQTGTSRVNGFILERMVLSYILRQVFKPMLVGLDKEAESLLLGLDKNLQSRMIASAADRWMAETLRAYTLLPIYPTDRQHFLNSHSAILQEFFDCLAWSRANDGSSSIGDKVDNELLHSVMEQAVNLASEMSFSYSQHSIDWDYCNEKEEILKRELDAHDICLLDGSSVNRYHFQSFGDDEKVADVVMFVRPPIIGMDRIGNRRIWGNPLVIVEPVPGYDPNPCIPETKPLADLLVQMKRWKVEEAAAEASGR